jgi:hypothetical protein
MRIDAEQPKDDGRASGECAVVGKSGRSGKCRCSRKSGEAKRRERETERDGDRPARLSASTRWGWLRPACCYDYYSTTIIQQ